MRIPYPHTLAHFQAEVNLIGITTWPLELPCTGPMDALHFIDAYPGASTSTKQQGDA